MAPERARYRFGPLERRGLVAGWRGGQIAAVAGGLVLAVLALRSRPTPAPWPWPWSRCSAGWRLACWPVAGRTGEEWAPTVARWGGPRRPEAAAPGAGAGRRPLHRARRPPVPAPGGPVGPRRCAARPRRPAPGRRSPRAPPDGLRHPVRAGRRLRAGAGTCGVVHDAPDPHLHRRAAGARATASPSSGRPRRSGGSRMGGRAGLAGPRALAWCTGCSGWRPPVPDDGARGARLPGRARRLPATRRRGAPTRACWPEPGRARAATRCCWRSRCAPRAPRGEGGAVRRGRRAGACAVLLPRGRRAAPPARRGRRRTSRGCWTRGRSPPWSAAAASPARRRPRRRAAGTGAWPARTGGPPGGRCPPCPVGGPGRWPPSGVGLRADRRRLARHLLDRRVAPGRRRPGLPGPLLLGSVRRSVAVVMEPVSPARAVRQVEQARTADLADSELRRRGGFLATARRAREEDLVIAPRGGAGRRPRLVPLLGLRHGDRPHPRGARRPPARRPSRRRASAGSSSAASTASRSRRSPAPCRSAGGWRERPPGSVRGRRPRPPGSGTVRGRRARGPPGDGTEGPGPPGDHPQPRRRLPARGRGRARPPGGAGRPRPARRLLRLRPVRALRPGRGQQPQHDRLRADRPGQERVRQDLPLAPGGLRPPGLGGGSRRGSTARWPRPGACARSPSGPAARSGSTLWTPVRVESAPGRSGAAPGSRARPGADAAPGRSCSAVAGRGLASAGVSASPRERVGRRPGPRQRSGAGGVAHAARRWSSAMLDPSARRPATIRTDRADARWRTAATWRWSSADWSTATCAACSTARPRPGWTSRARWSCSTSPPCTTRPPWAS